jgi:phosphate transport system substrate-binding protein
LSQRQIYLALAKEIPDPHNPSNWIPNPFRNWSDVDSILPNEQIDIVGPGLDSSAWIAFQDTVLEPGCSAAPDEAEHIRHCKTVRGDGAYRAVPDDIRGYLDAHPNAMVLMAYSNFFPEVLRAVKLDGAEPTLQTFADGSYPGARTVYLYFDKPRTYAISRFIAFSGNLKYSIASQPDTTLTPLSEAERQANQEILTTTDVTP